MVSCVVFFVFMILSIIMNCDNEIRYFCGFLSFGLLFTYLYVKAVKLTINDAHINIKWPFQEEKQIEWKSVTQVRKSSHQGRHFYVDIITTPDLSIQVFPYMFEKSEEIIMEMNEHLKFDLMKAEPASGKQPGGLIIADMADDAGPSGANWILIAVMTALFISAIILIYMKNH